MHLLCQFFIGWRKAERYRLLHVPSSWCTAVVAPQTQSYKHLQPDWPCPAELIKTAVWPCEPFLPNKSFELALLFNCFVCLFVFFNFLQLLLCCGMPTGNFLERPKFFKQSISQPQHSSYWENRQAGRRQGLGVSSCGGAHCGGILVKWSWWLCQLWSNLNQCNIQNISDFN